MLVGEANNMRLRPKERKVYDDCVADEEIEGRRTFSVASKLDSDLYSSKLVKEVQGSELNMRYMQSNGFSTPLLVKDKTGLGMRVPSENFTVNDVKQCVGSRRQLDVMDVSTQTAMEMSMKEWVRYYTADERDRLLNVISLEFSHTRLENYVEQPEVVRQLDWVDRVWPSYYKDCQTETTNILDKMKYPKVQKYCLMSVKGCYTDFHIDMGGTSVWYHILKGRKIFWLIPPTDVNLALYEQWTLSGKQGDIFFGDKVSQCQRIELEAGWTFFIPTGWIHAVYTPDDSLVFGGNFLHTFNAQMQIRVWDVENTTHVPGKFRYPYFTELHWYVLQRYVSQLMGKEHRTKSKEEMNLMQDDDLMKIDLDYVKNNKESEEGYSSPQSPLEADHNYVSSPAVSVAKSEQSSSGLSSCASSLESKNNDLVSHIYQEMIRPVSVKLEDCLLQDKSKLLSSIHGKPWVHLVQNEMQGLQTILDWVKQLPVNKRSVPKDILDPDLLIQDAEKLLKQHSDDDPHLAVTGEPILKGQSRKGNKVSYYSKTPKQKQKGQNKSSATRRRRVRCRACEPCTRDDCRECSFCKDMKKYGGPGRMKQTCFCRQCISPVLPTSSVCVICSVDQRTEEEETTLMECGVCWEVVHPRCLREHQPELTNEGLINEDLPNSWECPKCCICGQQELCNVRSRSSPLVLIVNCFLISQPRVPKGLAKAKRNDSLSNDSVKEVKRLKMTDRGDEKEEGEVRVAEVVLVKLPTPQPDCSDSSDSDSSCSSRKRQTKPPLKSPPKRVSSRSDSSPQRKSRPPTPPQQQPPPPEAPPGGKLTSRGRQAVTSHPVNSHPASPNNSKGGDAKPPPKEGQRSLGGGKEEEKSAEDSPKGGGGGEGAGQPLPGTSTTEASDSPRKECSLSPMYVVRPAPISPPPKTVPQKDDAPHSLSRAEWMRVFQLLSPKDLACCMCVCKTFHRWCLSPLLWENISLERRRIRKTHLLGIVVRQPKKLNLNWTNINRQQMEWLMPRLPHLQELQLSGNAWGSVSALCSFICPLLTSVDLSWLQGFGDPALRDLVSPPIDRRPGLDDTVSRLHRLTTLCLAGTDISIESVKVILKHCPLVKSLDMSYCARLSNTAIAELTAPSANTKQNLTSINLTGCSKLTGKLFAFVEKFERLEQIVLRGCPSVSLDACKAFVIKMRELDSVDVQMKDEKCFKITRK
ncbi:hypothetical protein CAPTEDRAFT_226024 [Capitella teleta]|uniref:[histone H3]-dimethyl-L-lysine(36) demethylase n=1 Tax=Capitella teleta TaxID=283909 RepID=R7TJM6_CAPTE|nr:hypothetical protein CAPTEDRAFT_226024 [Capitella teleta]|eukprot:ELT93702.1 hypothetical protein CAPTEDRAFT_226024 [Capitella teleta]